MTFCLDALVDKLPLVEKKAYGEVMASIGANP
jgi:hypothetical protein